MAWYHVEDTKITPVVFKSTRGQGEYRRVETSTDTVGHSIWRCGHCRALAVTLQGGQPDFKCGKCKL